MRWRPKTRQELIDWMRSPPATKPKQTPKKPKKPPKTKKKRG